MSYCANYSDALTAQGFIVESFPDREGAMAVFQSRLPDLVIIDIGLGSEVDGGYAICQWLRQRSKTLPILFLSARTVTSISLAGSVWVRMII